MRRIIIEIALPTNPSLESELVERITSHAAVQSCRIRGCHLGLTVDRGPSDEPVEEDPF